MSEENELAASNADLKARLAAAGIRELEEHGINDFSLRRVASNCHVSCATPYRYFHDRDDLIAEIIRAINHQWELLATQVTAAFPGDCRRQLFEICLATVRFWNANPNFRTILTADLTKANADLITQREKILAALNAPLHAYATERELPLPEEERLLFMLRTLVFGTVFLLGCQPPAPAANTQTWNRLRDELQTLLP